MESTSITLFLPLSYQSGVHELIYIYIYLIFLAQIQNLWKSTRFIWIQEPQPNSGRDYCKGVQNLISKSMYRKCSNDKYIQITCRNKLAILEEKWSLVMVMILCASCKQPYLLGTYASTQRLIKKVNKDSRIIPNGPTSIVLTN